MRFCMMESKGKRGVAASRDGGPWHVLFESEPGFPGTVDEIVRSGEGAFEEAMSAIEAGTAINPDDLKFLPPLTEAGKILCVGLNYKAHVQEGGMPMPTYPTVFARFNTGLIGHNQPLVRPTSSEQLDYESELAVIIGKKARHVSPERALECVVGYSIFNDGSIRDVQMRTPQWTIGKNFDGTGGFGPYLVTADELPPGCKGLRMVGRLNGEVVQETNLSDMIFDVATLISLLSEAMTLEPGDVIVTGTPSGVGISFKPPKLLKPGDMFEIEIERIGTLCNLVVDEK
ncbi:fumarylacetoacetate hydrolase family protein [Bradyrhizobium sp. ma5]|uniref:fumarylacetoacetate hydrolase family protein n=1 Tax=Bradyrhizobium sp. ma5 TaxID=3344828 RepID=UPI0035D3FCBB